MKIENVFEYVEGSTYIIDYIERGGVKIETNTAFNLTEENQIDAIKVSITNRLNNNPTIQDFCVYAQRMEDKVYIFSLDGSNFKASHNVFKRVALVNPKNGIRLVGIKDCIILTNPHYIATSSIAKETTVTIDFVNQYKVKVNVQIKFVKTDMGIEILTDWASFLPVYQLV